MSNNRWVRESWIGRQFLASNTWKKWVLRVAFDDFTSLMKENGIKFESPVILDAGCGQAFTFDFIRKYFSPKKLLV